MAKVTLFAFLLLALAVSVKPISKAVSHSNQTVAVAPGGDPPPTCPTRVCK
jgi:hypothetical protein